MAMTSDVTSVRFWAREVNLLAKPKDASLLLPPAPPLLPRDFFIKFQPGIR